MAKISNNKSVQWMPKVLEAILDLGGSATPNEVYNWIADKYNVSEELRAEKSDKGVYKFDNQVAWARDYLKWAGYIDSSVRGVWSLTKDGIDKAKKGMSLEEASDIFFSRVEYHKRIRENDENNGDAISSENSLMVESHFHENNSMIEPISYADVDIVLSEEEKIESTLLNKLLSLSPEGFEHFCKKLLRACQFEDVVVTQKTRDGGIDGYGTLAINPLVKIFVLFQCKRYQIGSKVSLDEVKSFAYTVHNKNVERGLFFTTSDFTKPTFDEFRNNRIELINGSQIVNLMLNQKLGVKEETVLRFDPSFFREFE